MITEFETGDRSTSTLVCSVCDHRWTRLLNAAGFIKRGNKPSCPACGFTNPRDNGNGIDPVEALRAALAEPLNSEPAPFAADPIRDVRYFNADGVLRHQSYGIVSEVLKTGIHVMLVGEAGSGKSSIAEQIADEFGLRVFTESCHALMTKYDVLGFATANGDFRASSLYEAFEFGGVYLLDEVDASNPSALVALNLLTSVGKGKGMMFPDGRYVSRHDDFYLIGGANTWGNGASNKYVREVLDAASLDRFAGIQFEYDETLELAILGDETAKDIVSKYSVVKHGRPEMSGPDWGRYVQKIRAAVKAADAQMLVTPRASFNGAALLAAGIPLEDVKDVALWKGTPADTRKTVEAYAA